MDRGAAVAAHRRRRRADRAAGADQRRASAKTIGSLPGGVLLVPDRDRRCCCVIAAFAKGGLGQIADVGDVPAWYYLTGGLLGAAYVTTVLVTVRTLGAGARHRRHRRRPAVAVDGRRPVRLLGVEKSPITALKVFGVLLLAAGTFLIVRE